MTHQETDRIMEAARKHGAETIVLGKWEADTLVTMRAKTVPSLASVEVWRGHLVGPMKPHAGPNEPGGPYETLQHADWATICEEIRRDAKALGIRVLNRS